MYNCNLLNGCHLFLCENVANEKNGKLSGLLSHFFLFVHSFIVNVLAQNAKVNKMLNGCYRWLYRASSTFPWNLLRSWTVFKMCSNMDLHDPVFAMCSCIVYKMSGWWITWIYAHNMHGMEPTIKCNAQVCEANNNKSVAIYSTYSDKVDMIWCLKRLHVSNAKWCFEQLVHLEWHWYGMADVIHKKNKMNKMERESGKEIKQCRGIMWKTAICIW